MSRMSDLAVDIEELLLEGKMTNKEIAEQLDVPVDWVVAVERQIDGD